MAAVQIVPTHVVRASYGQAAASNELHYSPQLGFPVSEKLRRAVEMHTGYWECSYIHCNTPIQVQRANYAEESSANNRLVF